MQAKPESMIVGWLTEAGAKKTPLGAVTAYPEEIANKLIQLAGLKTEIAMEHLHSANGSDQARAETWRSLAHQMNASPRQCVALVSSAVAGRAALIAGMRCVVIPNTLSIHQDFGGIDIVVEDQNQPKLSDILSLTNPAQKS